MTLDRQHRGVAALVVTALGGAAVARACFFGASWQLLDDRAATLHQAPANSFAWEAARLAPASPWARAKPAPEAGASQDAHGAAERAGLSATQVSALAAMRAAPDSRWALSAAGSLPESVRLYTGGAVAFLHGNLTDAREYFSFVLALPPDRAAPRAAWAQYMLGRVAQKSAQPAEAETAFAAVRDRVVHGAPDPLDLATASLGEQARLRLVGGDVPGAVALYAEQAADGSDEAVQSLRMVAENVMKTPDRLPALVRDRLTQRLLVVHALALTGDYLHQLWIGGTENSIGTDGFYPPDSLDLGPLRALMAAIRGSGVAVAELDRLAALAYRLGQAGDAQVFANGADTPLALWVRAKLALQGGMGTPGVARLFAAALHAAEATKDGGSVEAAGTGLLRGETAVATLTSGDFVQAADIMWPVARIYWGDFAYLAERVLTTPELQDFVAAHAAAPVTGATGQADPVNAVRNLLARRLVREGRVADALPYFDRAMIGEGVAAQAGTSADTRADAAAYGQAADRARSALWPAERAQAAWTAATLLRTRGMELMGTEEAPDQAYIRGEVPEFLGPGSGGPASRSDPESITQAEKIRFDDSRPRPDLRFHYRYLAIDQALAAAADLPPRSQAYAAVLCRAAGWSFGLHDRDRARAVWRSYVAHGARVSFARHFGHDCPAPDFGGLWRTRQLVAEVALRKAVHGRKTSLAEGAGAALVLLGGTWLLGRRRVRVLPIPTLRPSLHGDGEKAGASPIPRLDGPRSGGSGEASDDGRKP